MSLPNRFCYRFSSPDSRLPMKFYRFDFVVYSIHTQNTVLRYIITV